MKTKAKHVFVAFLLCVLAQGTWAQTSWKYQQKPRITDIGVVATDAVLWVAENEETQQPDTTVTTETYILWQSDGDLEEQARQHQADKEAIVNRHREQVTAQGARRVKPIDQEGLLHEAFATFNYYVFTFEYPSVDADGQEVMLSGIAACPTKDADEVRDIVMGTHVTITADSQRPSAQTNGFKKEDWGVLMSMAAGKKMKLGWRTNLTFGILLPAWPFWMGLGIAGEVKSGKDAYNNNLVILADYEGYGKTKDRAHPYLYQELTARQVVDATRAGIELYKTDSGLKDIRHPIRNDFRSISCGYSQGGSVALATHRYIEQNGLVDELHFAGSLCGDGPYDPMATLMYYMKQCSEEKKPMSMPVVLPLIVKGMLDTNPFMTGHKAEDYFNPKFLEMGIMDWLTSKDYSTDDIEAKFRDCYNKGMHGNTSYFRDLYVLDGNKNPHLMMSSIMNEGCYNYFKGLYDQYKKSYTSKEGVPVPTQRGVYEDLHLALASNDMTQGWTPQHAIMLYHSNSDTVVPYDNATSAVNRLGGWTVLHTAKEGLDHVPSGTDFFQGSNGGIVKNFAIRLYVAKKQLCDLPWKNQTKGAITEFE